MKQISSDTVYEYSATHVIMHHRWFLVLLFVAIFDISHGSKSLLDNKLIGNRHLRRIGKESQRELSHTTGERKSIYSDNVRIVSAEDQSRNTFSLNEINTPSNRISLNEINALIDSQEKKEMKFQDTIVTVKISPVETLLEDQKERIIIFERGYLEFLNKLFAGASTNEYARVDVRSVNVLQSEFDKLSDHTVNVLCHIQTSCESSLSPDNLSNLIAEISDKWSSRILQLWSGIEQSNLIVKTEGGKHSYIDEDAMFFGLLQNATVDSSKPPSETTSESNSSNESKNVIVVFVLSFGAILITIVGMFVTKKYLIHRGADDYNKERKNSFYSVTQDPNTNLHELDEIQLTPTQSIFSSTMATIGNLSPFRVPNDESFDKKIQRFDKSKKAAGKYKAPSRKSGYDRIISDTEDDGSLQKHYECWAPPGKLGVAIDTVDNKLVVHRVKEDSPLKGVIAERDLILAIDDIDTTHMSAADVTYLMVKKMKHERKITYMKALPNESKYESNAEQ